MRLVTPTRLRAVGMLLLDAAILGVILIHRVSKDGELRYALADFARKARSL